MSTDAELPLRGVAVVVTREEEDDEPLSRTLAVLGAQVLAWPTLSTRPPDDPAPLDRVLGCADSYDWLVLTSRRAVAAVRTRIGTLPTSLRVAAVGRKTSDAAREAGWRVDLVPEDETGDGLVRAFRALPPAARPARVLFPASEIAGDTVPEGLEAIGAEVTRVVAYRMVPAPLDAAACETALAGGGVDVVTFTSPSAVANLRAALGEDLFGRLLRATAQAVIGPTTAAAVRAAGGERVIESEEASMEGLARAVARWSENRAARGAP